MNAAICLLLYGAAMTWLTPPLLVRLTRSGLSPRLSVALWLSAVGLALGAWAVVGVGLALDVATGKPDGGPVEYCMQAVSALNRFGALGHAMVAVAGSAALLSSTMVAHRIIKALRRFWAISRDHAREARILGSSSRCRDVVVLASDRPAAYCVAGRPHAIVLTTAAVDVLGEAELAAVVAHERAHLSGHHLQLMMLLRALATAMPRLPLFGHAAASVGRLVEMCADDAAARRHGRPALVSGLVALAGQKPLTDNALGAADTAAFARAMRLTSPARRAARMQQRILLTVTIMTLSVAPLVITALCHSR